MKLRAENLIKTYKKRTVVKGISVEEMKAIVFAFVYMISKIRQ